MAKKRENEFEKLAKLITVQADKTEEKLARLIKIEGEDIRKQMATKEQVVALHTQVNSIEGQLRGMKYATNFS